MTKQATINWPASGNEVKEGQYGPYTTVGVTIGQNNYAVYGKPGDTLSGLPKGAKVFVQITEEPDPANNRKRGKAKFVDVCEYQPTPQATPDTETVPADEKAAAAYRLISGIYLGLDRELAGADTKPTSDDIARMTNTIFISIYRP